MGWSVRVGLAFLIVCLGMSAATGWGASPPIREGGVLHVNASDGVTTLDPAVNYTNSGWEIFYATCAKLVNYPDASGSTSRVVPEVAAALPRVSDGGRTYMFTIRDGFRFNTGDTVTAASFAAAINRDLVPAMHSPAVAFLQDVVGAQAVAAGKAQTASGVVANGSTLTVQLLRPAPDFVARMAMSFFCAVPTSLPARPQGMTPIPMAGPYYMTTGTGPYQIVLKQNPYYGGTRSRHLSEIKISLSVDSTESTLEIAKGSADYDIGSLDPTVLRAFHVAHTLGTAQLVVHPDVELLYLVFNTRRPLFANARLRQAVNFAINRQDILNSSGDYGRPTDQILPPAMPGFKDAKLYPLSPDIQKARALAGTERRVAVLYSNGRPPQDFIALVVASDLAKIGITVQISPYPKNFNPATAAFDISIGDWTADYLDPYDFINVMLNGAAINTLGSQNTGGFNDPHFNQAMNEAATLAGQARLNAYAHLDANLMRNAAPIAPVADVYLPELISHRVRFDCSAFPPQVAGLDLATTCLK